MRFIEFRMTLVGLSCAAAVAGLLAGCGGSTSAAAGAGSSISGGGSTSGTGSGGSSNPPPVTGIDTPKSVSVVTAK